MAIDRSKVLWLEGMTLDPHHFQQWDRYQSHQIRARIRAVQRHFWGLTGLAIDEDRLSNGEFVLTSCDGVLSDGYAFSLPEDDRLPASRNVAEAFGQDAAGLDVYLCLPSLRTGANLDGEGESSSTLARFGADTLAVSDENTGRDERIVEIARTQFQIRFGTEQLEGFSTIRIARLQRSTGGFYVLDKQFIPTSLVLRASDRLVSLASRALELSLAKSASLDERRLATASQRQLTPSDVTAIGLLSAVNRHIPVLRSLTSGAGCHPESLFNTLLSLAGELSAYSSDAAYNPREFPVYDHSDLSTCFNRIAELLDAALGGVQPTRNYRQLQLRPIRDNLFEAQVTDEELSKADLILSATSEDVPESRLASELPSMLRIASPDVIDGVLQAYTRALPIEHTNRLPVGMPEDALSSYFRLVRSGPYWDAICESNKLAIFVPEEYGEIEFKLAAVMK